MRIMKIIGRDVHQECREKFRVEVVSVSNPKKQGFALVIALSLMAFVLLLLLSISTLVSVEKASSLTTVSRIQAEQAALLSLNIALGNLQEIAGLDQRVTASAEAVADVRGVKQVTGVWRSWEGRDHQADGLPVAPDYASKLVTADNEIDVNASGAGRFLGWLVSSANDPIIADAKTPPDLAEQVGLTVALVGEGTVGAGSPDNEVHVIPTEFTDGNAAVAWWISGENTKALLQVAEESTDVLDWSRRLSSSTQADPSVFDITDTDKADRLDRVVSRSNLNLLSDRDSTSASVSEEFFHDLTTYSRGLLTNTATGGWRRDLSLLSEQWAQVDLPVGGANPRMYTLSPGVEAPATKGVAGGFGALMYPWAKEQDYEGTAAVQEGGASVSWDALVDYALQYQDISTGGFGTVILPIAKGGRDEVPRRPVIARIHWVLSFGAESATNGGYDAYLIANPVITIWNPYNVEISDHVGFKIRVFSPVPYGFKFAIDGASQDDFYSISQFAGDNKLTITVESLGETWKPGEARIFSANNVSSNKNVTMELGYRTDTGFKWGLYQTYTTKGVGTIPLNGSADNAFTVELQKNASASFGIECYGGGDNPMEFETHYALPTSVTDLYWPVLTPTTDVSLSDVDISVDGPAPFLVAIMQFRTVFAELTQESTTARGYADNKPALISTSTSIDGASYSPELYADGYPYDWLFFTPNDINGVDGLPQAGGVNNDIGFIGTGFEPTLGLNNLAVSGLPTRPLSSLGELQHFDINYYNPLPPYTANPIGNSSATFAIKSDQVYIEDGTPAVERTSFDHSYVANHISFDDWFVSSIAPDTSGASRTLSTVYSDFISDQIDLPNSSYRPAKQLSSDDAASAATDLIADNTAWHGVASEIEVEGMFNINSTSVNAWSALLKHLKNGSVPQLSVSEAAWDIQLETGSDNPVSRTTIAGDPSSQSDSEIRKLATYKRFTDTQIDALANEIVDQIKQRGPFLSLSEFINRQLTTDESAGSLSLAGTIEAALNGLQGGGATTNPFADLESSFPDRVDETIALNPVRPFDEASKGYRAYGFLVGFAKRIY